MVLVHLTALSPVAVSSLAYARGSARFVNSSSCLQRHPKACKHWRKYPVEEIFCQFCAGSNHVGTNCHIAKSLLDILWLPSRYGNLPASGALRDVRSPLSLERDKPAGYSGSSSWGSSQTKSRSPRCEATPEPRFAAQRCTPVIRRSVELSGIRILARA